MTEDAARSLIGVPWVHQGRHAALGVDCIGVGVIYLQSKGYVISDRSDYTRDPNGNMRKELVRTMGEPIAEGAGAGNYAQPGDVVWMEFSKHKPRHIGVISSHPHGLTVIHADNSAGKVVEHLIDNRWNRRIVGVWRPA